MAGRLRRIVAPLALFAGVFFFGMSLLMLGTEAVDNVPITLSPSSLTFEDGTGVLLYRADYFGSRTERIEVSYAFPLAPGDVHFIRCGEIAQVLRGDAPAAPLLSFTDQRDGTFVVSHQTIATDELRTIDQVEGRCDPALVFRWPSPNGDASTNVPDVTATYYAPSLDGDSFAFVAFLMVGSALAALLGGLAWARARRSLVPLPASSNSMVEALRASLERMGEQLERTRKHLLLAGVFGIFLWFPFLVPWAWQQAARSSERAAVPWAIASFTLLFLIALTILWAREFSRLDWELAAWRKRVAELQDREEQLMDTLDRAG